MHLLLGVSITAHHRIAFDIGIDKKKERKINKKQIVPLELAALFPFISFILFSYYLLNTITATTGTDTLVVWLFTYLVINSICIYLLHLGKAYRPMCLTHLKSTLNLNRKQHSLLFNIVFPAVFHIHVKSNYFKCFD